MRRLVAVILVLALLGSMAGSAAPAAAPDVATANPYIEADDPVDGFDGYTPDQAPPERTGGTDGG